MITTKHVMYLGVEAVELVVEPILPSDVERRLIHEHIVCLVGTSIRRLVYGEGGKIDLIGKLLELVGEILGAD